MPPFAGQGMSSGLRDAANVTWKLAAVIAGRSEDRLLDSYEAERRPHVASLTRLALGWGAVVQTRRPRLAAARDGAVATGTRLPGLRRAVEGYRMKPAAAFRAGAFSRSRRLPLGLRPGGRLFPQPRVGVDGRDMALDDALGPGWAVIGFGGDPEAGMGPAARFTLRRLPATRAAVLPAGAPAPPGVRALEDRDGALMAWARRHGARQVVLRPDRVVFAAAGARDAEAPAALWRALSGAR
jgi:3-(3-hydroxy-phenyl)propionate hydroxylase